MSIRKALILSFLSVSLILLISLLSVWIFTEIGNTKDDIKRIRDKSLVWQKDDLKSRVNNIITFIQAMRANSAINDSTLQLICLDWVESLRFEHGGYYFINQIDGQPLVFDGKRVTEKKSILNMTDPSGLRIFDLELKAYNNPDGEFITFLFEKMDSEAPEPKISFTSGIHDWGWIIGAGNSLKDLNKEIDIIHKNINSKLLKKS